MKISLVFATYNGEIRLQRMLNALKDLNYPKDDLQIIAVNNNSADQTHGILQSYTSALPLVILSEPRQGKSYALNKGLDSVPEDTDLIVLTDDDVIPDPNWLSSLVRAAEENPDYDIFGGEIRPDWEVEPESWVLNWVNCSMVYALNEGMPEGQIQPDLVFGPNSAFRAHLLNDMRLDTTLGPNTDSVYPMGNDTVLAKELSKQGHKAYHTPQAVVYHMIPAKHLEEDWILRRAERYGWGRALHDPARFKTFHSGLMSYWRTFEFFLFRLLHASVKAMPKTWLRYKILYGYYYYKGIYRALQEQA